MEDFNSAYGQHFERYLASERVNHPESYIEYLKSQPRFKDGLLDRLPRKAIILHDSRLIEHLALLGIDGSRIRKIRTGTADPNLIMVIYDEEGEPLCLINRGMPGGAAIAVQAAELAALGVEEIVHIGLCGLLGKSIQSGAVVIAKGSYKNGTAILLSSGNELNPMAHASQCLVASLQESLQGKGIAIVDGYGYTVDSFYLQPEDLILDLINSEKPFADPSACYIEMEQAALFSLANRMDVKAASLVVGSDRYTIEDGKLQHQFEQDFDQDETERAALRAALELFGTGQVISRS